MKIWVIIVIWALLSYLASLAAIKLDMKIGITPSPKGVGMFFFIWPFLLLQFIFYMISGLIGVAIMSIHGILPEQEDEYNE